MTSRPSTAAPILAVLAIVLVTTVGAYVGMYLCLSVIVHDRPEDPYIARVYSTAWLRDFFKPAAQVEGALRGKKVIVGSNLLEVIFGNWELVDAPPDAYWNNEKSFGIEEIPEEKDELLHINP